jgi:signal transduction histidine kinase
VATEAVAEGFFVQHLWELGGALAVSAQASILVVDDDAKSLMAMRELLQSPGLKVVVANSGQQALEHIVREDFAVVLLDARMPIMDGFETSRRMREHERARHTPIIFLTGAYEDPPSMFRGYEAGAVDYIVKPPVPEILRSKIAVFVELYNKSADLRALAARVQSVQEEEQRRIAREIHDELGQALTALKMDLSWMSGRLPPENERLLQKTKDMAAQIDRMVHSVRELAAGCGPKALDELGLAAAIKWQAREFQLRAGIRCNVALPEEEIELDQDRATAIFRIFQELLTNVVRHAAATKVDRRAALSGRRPAARGGRRRPWHCRDGDPQPELARPARHARAHRAFRRADGDRAAPRRLGYQRARAHPAAGDGAGAGAVSGRRHDGNGATMRILIADDHPVVRLGLKQMLPRSATWSWSARRRTARRRSRWAARWTGTWRCSTTPCPDAAASSWSRKSSATIRTGRCWC